MVIIKITQKREFEHVHHHNVIISYCCSAISFQLKCRPYRIKILMILLKHVHSIKVFKAILSISFNFHTFLYFSQQVLSAIFVYFQLHPVRSINLFTKYSCFSIGKSIQKSNGYVSLKNFSLLWRRHHYW
jgi:hypothetical protein